MNTLRMKWQAVQGIANVDKPIMVTELFFPDSLAYQLERT